MTNRVIDGQILGQQLGKSYIDTSFLKTVFCSEWHLTRRQTTTYLNRFRTIGALRFLLVFRSDPWPNIPLDPPGWLTQLYSFNHQNLRLEPMLTTSPWTRQWRVSVPVSVRGLFLILSSFSFLSSFFFLNHGCFQVSATCSRTIWRRAIPAYPPLLTTFLSCLILLTTWLICLA